MPAAPNKRSRLWADVSIGTKENLRLLAKRHGLKNRSEALELLVSNALKNNSDNQTISRELDEIKYLLKSIIETL